MCPRCIVVKSSEMCQRQRNTTRRFLLLFVLPLFLSGSLAHTLSVLHVKLHHARRPLVCVCVFVCTEHEEPALRVRVSISNKAADKTRRPNCLPACAQNRNWIQFQALHSLCVRTCVRAWVYVCMFANRGKSQSIWCKYLVMDSQISRNKPARAHKHTHSAQ